MILMRIMTGFNQEELFYSDSVEYADIGVYSSEFRFLGLLLLIFLAGCAVVGFVMLRRQWRRTRLNDPRKDHYRRER